MAFANVLHLDDISFFSLSLALSPSLSLPSQVRVEVETCENLRPPTSADRRGKAASYATGGQYGYVDKVVDGVTVTVNSVILTLKSRVFTASFQVQCYM